MKDHLDILDLPSDYMEDGELLLRSMMWTNERQRRKYFAAYSHLLMKITNVIWPLVGCHICGNPFEKRRCASHFSYPNFLLYHHRQECVEQMRRIFGQDLLFLPNHMPQLSEVEWEDFKFRQAQEFEVMI